MNPKEEMAGITLSLHAKQPKRATLSYDRAYIEIFEYPRASEAVITWTEDGRKEVLREGDTKMALSYEVSDMEKTLYTVDELTGLIGAAARMRPSKSVSDMEVSSLKKKFKDKKFAAGCSRDVIKTGAERLGWTLEELMDRTLQAQRSCEESVAAQMAALG